MKNNIVSIVIPLYNAEKYIEETLKSAISQTYKDIEIICVDDCSTDNSAKIIKKYVKKHPKKVFYFKLNKNTGSPVVPKNEAILKAKGEFILPLDADDLIDKEYVKKAMNVFKSNKDISVVYCKTKLFGLINEDSNIKPYCPKKMLVKNFVMNSGLFKKADWKRYNGYNINMQNGLEDWDFWLNFTDDKKIFSRIEEYLFYYRKLDCSRSNIACDNSFLLWKQIKKNHKSLYSFKNYIFNKYLLKKEMQNLRRSFFQIKIKNNYVFIKLFGIVFCDFEREISND
jgi:glycosyltransferase involved in cell wall biosynthesis